MSAPETEQELSLEIAHLLLIDIVGYSRLLVNEQIETLRQLNLVVRSCDSFRAADSAGKLIRLPTGDGMALLFFGNPEQPLRCAIEITTALKQYPAIRVRMGIHSGPVNQVRDVNDSLNVAGTGINIAQRVMDCGDAGHILLSRHIADDLAEYRKWNPFLRDLGECTVKHGMRLHLVNFCKDEIGNPETPSRLRTGRRHKPSTGDIRALRPARTPLVAIGLATGISIIALALGLWVLLRHSSSPILPTSTAIPLAEKSIAVLPFANLSDGKQNGFLADGVQDEILTDLSHLADLKVISRTSVMQYRDESKRNIRDIAKELGVTYILEGTVQFAADVVRVSAQLIDARTDTHVWADHFDRPLADVFALQSEVAETIVDQLRLRISPAEREAIKHRPTSDLIAFDYFIRAKDLIERAVFNAPRDEQLVEAIGLLEKAIERDGSFFEAYFQLAHAHDQIYFLGTDHTPSRLAVAESAIARLNALRPDSAEVHLARAKHLYWCYRDYDGARREIGAIGTRLPNDPWPFVILGYIDRRQSHWDDSTRNLERALALDPRNFSILNQVAITYEDLRRFEEAIGMIDRALKIAPNDVATILYRASLEMQWRNDLQPFVETAARMLKEHPEDAAIVATEWLNIALRQRNAEDARLALAMLPADGCRDETLLFPKGWCEGRVALIANDRAGAKNAFSEALAIAEKTVREQPKYAEGHCIAGLLHAELGHKSEAVREGQQAVALVSLQQDSLIGARLISYLAQIYTVCGDKDRAFEQLKRSVSIPCGLTYDELAWDPTWDLLRSDTRFDQLLSSLAPTLKQR